MHLANPRLRGLLQSDSAGQETLEVTGDHHRGQREQVQAALLAPGAEGTDGPVAGGAGIAVVDVAAKNSAKRQAALPPKVVTTVGTGRPVENLVGRADSGILVWPSRGR